MTMTSLLVAVAVGVLGGGCLLLTLLTLPGNWLLVLVAVGAQVWAMIAGGDLPYSGWTLGALVALAVLGELAEAGMGAAGAKAGGARSRGAWGAVAGSLVGAMAGTVALAFVPVVGTLLGALGGAALGAVVGELTYGDRDAASVVRPATGAAIGRFAGILVKFAIGVVMWVVAVAAAAW